MSDIEIYREILTLPDDLKKQVSDFIAFLKSKNSANPKKQRRAGLAKGLIKMSDDFDEPLDDFKEYMQ